MNIQGMAQRIGFGMLVGAASVAIAAGFGITGVENDVRGDRMARATAVDLVDHPHIASPLADEGFESDVKPDVSRIESASVVTHVEVVSGGQRPKIILLDPDGAVVYESDPLTNTTVLARDVVIPSVTVRETTDSVAELRIVTAAKPIRVPDELREALTAELDEPEGMFYREDL